MFLASCWACRRLLTSLKAKLRPHYYTSIKRHSRQRRTKEKDSDGKNRNNVAVEENDSHFRLTLTECCRGTPGSTLGANSITEFNSSFVVMRM